MHDHITFYTLKTTSVTGFIKTLGTCNTIPIVNADVEYYCEIAGKSIILSIHNALYFKGMMHNLIPPFVMILAGLEVHEWPKFLSCNPTMRHHSILFP